MTKQPMEHEGNGILLKTMMKTGKHGKAYAIIQKDENKTRKTQ